MSKKHTFKKTAALALSIALTVGSTGCNFFPTDSRKDLDQVVANVNISESLEKDATYSASASDVKALVDSGAVASDIYKRDLIAYFLSVGYTYVQNYGYSYEDTFNMLMETLVNQKIVTQYAVAYYLSKDGISAEACEAYVNSNMDANADEERKDILKQVLTMKYFLTDGGKEDATEDYIKAEYQLKQTFNSSLDSLESSYITASEEEHNHGEARTTPTGVGTEKEDYYPVTEEGALDYDVYTGRNTLDSCGEYEKVEGSTTATRKKAYNSFLANLQGYNLIGKDENTATITDLDYYYIEFSTLLVQSLLTKYYDDLQEEVIGTLKDEYVAEKYNEIKEAQQYSYAADSTAFETALGSVADDSFVLYGEENFGFVYNILIPFSASQEQAYSAAKNKGLTENELFNARKNILKGVQAKDLRDTWFSEHDHANYAYEVTEGYYNNASEKGEKTYLFFEDSIAKTDRYESLTQYAGKYPYNGTVTEGDHEYTFKANKMDIDGFLKEMEGYINYVVDDNVASGDWDTKYNSNVYTDDKGVVDYSKFVYYTGKVALSDADVKASDYFNKESKAYKALSAVNELMFAYSTDTGCLNTYMGYVVSPYDTDFVGEFEYAARYAIEQGVGTYVVCPSDYGWHIIYVSFVYEGGEVYDGYNAAEKDVEGTFSNIFYESLKTTIGNNHTKEVESNVLNVYNNDTSVTLYTSRYQDLLDMQA